jgi:hypothetical protein
MFQPIYLIQQTFDLTEAMQFSTGLVVVCLAILMIFWLPGILNNK